MYRVKPQMIRTKKSRPFHARFMLFKRLIFIFIVIISFVSFFRTFKGGLNITKQEITKLISPNKYNYNNGKKWPQLAMKGGDPYIRALMRTISASESNYPRPYHVVYTGKNVSNLSKHPDWCITIVSGPNKGNCTTAAGRYQMLTNTWHLMAKRYHPQRGRFMFWESYSFEPKYQDAVVHGWLSDRKYWKADIPGLLRRGKLDRVLRLLSGTWTSLGYGIETNSMSKNLPRVYREVLENELSLSRDNFYQKNEQSLIVEYFPKDVDNGVVEKALRTLDYQLILQPTVVADMPSNSIWFGSAVSIKEVKLVAEKLISSGVNIKAIRPFNKKVEFSDLLIRVGADPEVKNRPSLTLEDVREKYSFTRDY
ncbi:MAG: glycoside hydrolase family protein [Okeania sp. SIO3H1]|nr:glycoside hydrolase family protein [Okeania sp. SIO3H1]NET28040.1 glycoside hydrolase family protein [Okeania sp. SIO1I7]